MMAAPSLKVLLANSIDYAGMFPPCSLALGRTLQNQADLCARPIDVERLRYRRSKVGAVHLNRPILAAFIVGPVARRSTLRENPATLAPKQAASKQIAWKSWLILLSRSTSEQKRNDYLR